MNWHDSIYQIYVLITLATLGAGGAVLAALKFGLRRSISAPWAAFRGWLVMAPLVLLVVGLGRAAVIVFVVLLAMGGFLEFARATGLARDRLLTAAVLLAIAAAGVLSAVGDPHLPAQGWYGFFMALPMWVTALLLVIPVLRNQPQGRLQAVSLAVIGFIYFGWMFGHLAFLANARFAVGYLLFLFFAVSVCDVAAFTFGKLFGHRKLCSNISPNKTIGGSIGAMGVGLAMPWLLQFSFPRFDSLMLLLVGLVVGLGGQLGDLAISFIKRDLQIKDMGQWIPGHGGILDRIDSLIYTSPIFFHSVRWFYDL